MVRYHPMPIMFDGSCLVGSNVGILVRDSRNLAAVANPCSSKQVTDALYGQEIIGCAERGRR